MSIKVIIARYLRDVFNICGRFSAESKKIIYENIQQSFRKIIQCHTLAIFIEVELHTL